MLIPLENQRRGMQVVLCILQLVNIWCVSDLRIFNAFSLHSWEHIFSTLFFLLILPFEKLIIFMPLHLYSGELYNCPQCPFTLYICTAWCWNCKTFLQLNHSRLSRSRKCHKIFMEGILERIVKNLNFIAASTMKIFSVAKKNYADTAYENFRRWLHFLSITETCGVGFYGALSSPAATVKCTILCYSNAFILL
jgi:hypothetical protein